MNKEFIEELLYEEVDVIEKLQQVTDEKTLFVYLYNYNWDDGFDIPKRILENPHCSLSVALLMFYHADGYNYLNNKNDNDNSTEYNNFIKLLYESILNKKFTIGVIGFKVPLTKIQIFKLKKIISSTEEIFIDDIIGEDAYISI